VNQKTPLEALQTLDGILAEVPGGRAYHAQLQQLVQIVARAIVVPAEPEPPVTSDESET